MRSTSCAARQCRYCWYAAKSWPRARRRSLAREILPQLRCLLQSFAQGGLIVLAERSLEYLAFAAESLQTFQYLVECRASYEHEQGRGAGLKRVADFAHHVVVDTDVPELPRNRSCSGAHGGAQQRIQEQQTDQQPPESTTDRTGLCKAHRLVELRLALLIARHYHRGFEVDEIVLLHFQERRAHLECRRLIVEYHRDQVAHVTLLACDDELAHFRAAAR